MIKEKICKIAWTLCDAILKTYMISSFIVVLVYYSGIENTFTNVIKTICYIHIGIGIVLTIFAVCYIKSTIKLLKNSGLNECDENCTIIKEKIESFKNLVDSNSSFYDAQKKYVEIRRLLDDPNFLLDKSNLSEIMPEFNELTSRMIKLDLVKN